jgi:DNA-binding response OmpR family regulator
MDEVENKRVLIVDDDPMIRHILQTILEEEGYSVQLAENGADGVDVLHKDGIAEPFRFMVLDMMMPKMTGIEVLAALRDQPAFEKLPIIMLTAESKPTDILTGYSAGASYYMTKPFTREQLLRGIELVLTES